MRDSRLKQQFETEIISDLKKELGRDNSMAVPTLEKIVVSMGVGSSRDNDKYLEDAEQELALITGQQPAFRLSKKAISGFSLRKGEKVGLMVTLRKKKMWDFYDKLVTVVLPRLRDFRGVPRKSFDGFGNYTIGLKEHLVFPEINPNQVSTPKGLKITVVTTAENDQEGRLLLEKTGMPFVKEVKQDSEETKQAS